MIEPHFRRLIYYVKEGKDEKDKTKAKVVMSFSNKKLDRWLMDKIIEDNYKDTEITINFLNGLLVLHQTYSLTNIHAFQYDHLMKTMTIIPGAEKETVHKIANRVLLFLYERFGFLFLPELFKEITTPKGYRAIMLYFDREIAIEVNETLKEVPLLQKPKELSLWYFVGKDDEKKESE